VNAAAFTDVNRAELEPFEAYRTNCLVVEHLSSFGIPLIHFSTDFVYSGNSDVPYKETDSTEPISAYGKTKLLGDQALAKSGTPHINLRTSWVYGPTGNNFVRKILSLLETREEITVVTDEVGAPTSVKSLSSIVLAILNQPDPAAFIAEHSGVYHACDKGFMSRYEMAKEIQNIAKDLGFAHKATKITGESSQNSASRYLKMRESIRPKNSRLDTAKLEALLPGSIVDAKTRLRNVLYDIFMLYHN
jgi:dTDP-4-dehydrorhamnose reductase